MNRYGTFAITLDDGRSLVPSRQPLLDTARLLLSEGENPNAWIEMRRARNPGMLAASGQIGVCAKLTVREDRKIGPVFVPYRPFQNFDTEDGA
ncbi:hypothetical protein [Bradyrhizobium sp. CCGB20]|uniref:hypothetical protein n=1 Tax=Bradyrhizobium sp. CCGB20 TaxID=2949633 RepID=UPI0020B204DF|nr:hypothetical protein [Bradyrhizobium sp. CCGB20]MCP3400491.1 hypothetical protein [Bradyrhizobium sp. CCGB20]